MLRGLPASIIAHAAVVSASYLTWPYWGGSSSAYITNVEAVDVNFAEIGEITDIAPLIAQEPEEEEVAPEEPEEEVVEEDPVDEELPEAEQDVTTEDEAPAPEPDPEDLLPDFDNEPEEEPEVEPEPETPEPEPRRSRNDDLFDLLNQSESTFKSERETRRERPDPTPPPETTSVLKDAPKPAETRDRRGAGERNANTVRLEALISSRIRNECWAGVDDLPNPERYNVHMKVLLNQDGTVSDLRVIDPKGRQSGYMRTAVDRATSAVGKCVPFKLPADDYELWKEIDVYLGLGYGNR